MARKKKWTREELMRVFEILVENEAPILTHPIFRKLLDRDENLFCNQIVREANGNIAYRLVDFDLDGLDDEDFWEMIDGTPYNDLIEENAAVALVKMAEKLDIVE